MNSMDLLRMEYINSLPQPFIARLYGGSEWPVHDIDVETGMIRLDVAGKLDVSHVGNVRAFIDAAGGEHDADDFYLEAAATAPDPAREAEMFREADGLEREHPLRTALRDYRGLIGFLFLFALVVMA